MIVRTRTLAAFLTLIGAAVLPGAATAQNITDYFANTVHPGFQGPEGFDTQTFGADVDAAILDAIAPAAGGPLGTVEDKELVPFEGFEPEEFQMVPDEPPENTGP